MYNRQQQYPDAVATCVEIKLQTPTPSTRRCPRNCVCSMAWRFTTASALIPRITWLTGRVPHRRATDRGRPWARPGRIQFWALHSRRRRQRTELSSFSAQIDRAVHAARRLDAAASGTWVLGGLKRWPAGPSTTRTASFQINGTTETCLRCAETAAEEICVVASVLLAASPESVPVF